MHIDSQIIRGFATFFRIGRKIFRLRAISARRHFFLKQSAHKCYIGTMLIRPLICIILTALCVSFADAKPARGTTPEEFEFKISGEDLPSGPIMLTITPKHRDIPRIELNANGFNTGYIALFTAVDKNGNCAGGVQAYIPVLFNFYRPQYRKYSFGSKRMAEIPLEYLTWFCFSQFSKKEDFAQNADKVTLSIKFPGIVKGSKKDVYFETNTIEIDMDTFKAAIKANDRDKP